MSTSYCKECTNRKRQTGDKTTMVFTESLKKWSSFKSTKGPSNGKMLDVSFCKVCNYKKFNVQKPKNSFQANSSVSVEDGLGMPK